MGHPSQGSHEGNAILRAAPFSFHPEGLRKVGGPLHPIPESARSVCLALFTGGFLYTVFAGMGIYLVSTDDIDALGKAITTYLAVVAVGLYIAAVLVRLRVPFATVAATIVTLPCLVFFPLGTIVAIIILKYLFAEDTRQFLA